MSRALCYLRKEQRKGPLGNMYGPKLREHGLLTRYWRLHLHELECGQQFRYQRKSLQAQLDSYHILTKDSPNGGLTALMQCILTCVVILVAACLLVKACPLIHPPNRISTLEALPRLNSLPPMALCQSFSGPIIFSKHKAMVIKILFYTETTKVLSSSKRTVASPAAREPSISTVASISSPTASILMNSLSSIVSYRRDGRRFLHQASARQTLLQVPKTYHELTRLTSVITSHCRSVLDNHLYSILSILPDS
jgi:hypothetical protein